MDEIPAELLANFDQTTIKWRELKLPPDYTGLVIFDNFNGQCTEDVLKLIDGDHINVIITTANCTDRLQPMDLAVNKALKDRL